MTAPVEPRSDLALDLHCLVVRLEQIDRDGGANHWMWDRVINCDVRRLREHLDRLKPGWDADL